MSMANRKLASPLPDPECAICLETCTDKCHSDSCMHQFCYKCLLSWSEIKEECPVCKQAFNSIIHDIHEYDDDHLLSDHDSADSDIIIVVSDTCDTQEDQPDRSSDPIINVEDTDSDGPSPLLRMVPRVGQEEERNCSTTRQGENRAPISPAKRTHRHTKRKTCAKKRQRYVWSDSSSSTSESEATESDPDGHEVHQQRKRLKRKSKGNKKAKSQKTH